MADFLVLLVLLLPVTFVVVVTLLLVQRRRRSIFPKGFGAGGGGRWGRRGFSGDREPRHPLRPAGAGAITLPEPRSEAEVVDAISQTFGDASDGSSGAVA